jgi:hypothetical protein
MPLTHELRHSQRALYRQQVSVDVLLVPCKSAFFVSMFDK